MKIENVAICGMGALGLLFGAHIAGHGGSVRYVMDAARLEKYGGQSFRVNGAGFRPEMRDGAKEAPADLLIVAVKATGLDAALNAMAKCVGEDTVILSVMNGITSEEILADRFGAEHVVYAVAQGMDAVKAGGELTYTKMGQIIVGARTPRQEENVRAVAEFFDRAGMPYAVEADILRRLWGKLMLNVGINQACMVYETNYGGCLVPGSEPYRAMIAAMREVIAVAHSEGVDIGEDDLNGYVRLLRTLDPAAMPSMRQDALAKRPTEVALFAGTIRALAEKHGLLVPQNDCFYERIRAMEAAY